jgi:hypothetical protein
VTLFLIPDTSDARGGGVRAGSARSSGARSKGNIRSGGSNGKNRNGKSNRTGKNQNTKNKQKTGNGGGGGDPDFGGGGFEPAVIDQPWVNESFRYVANNGPTGDIDIINELPSDDDAPTVLRRDRPQYGSAVDTGSPSGYRVGSRGQFLPTGALQGNVRR